MKKIRTRLIGKIQTESVILRKALESHPKGTTRYFTMELALAINALKTAIIDPSGRIAAELMVKRRNNFSYVQALKNHREAHIKLEHAFLEFGIESNEYIEARRNLERVRAEMGLITRK